MDPEPAVVMRVERRMADPNPLSGRAEAGSDPEAAGAVWRRWRRRDGDGGGTERAEREARRRPVAASARCWRLRRWCPDPRLGRVGGWRRWRQAAVVWRWWWRQLAAASGDGGLAGSARQRWRRTRGVVTAARR